MSAENKALIRRWFEEVWTKGRADAIDEMLASDSIIHGLGDEAMGPAGFKTFHSAYRSAFPDVTVHVDDVVAEGDMVALRWTAAATHRGHLMGLAPTGQSARFGGMGIVRVRDGKIVESWNVFDQLGMFKQLGVASIP